LTLSVIDNRVEFHWLHWALISCLLVNHSKEIRRCIFNSEAFVQASPSLRGENAAAMDSFEISIREFVLPLPVFSVLVIYPQEPLAILDEPILFDEFVLDLRGRVVVAPRIAFVIGKLTFLDKSLGVFIAGGVELYGHRLSPYRIEIGKPSPLNARGPIDTLERAQTGLWKQNSGRPRL